MTKPRPRTAAGRALLSDYGIMADREFLAAILAIEAEAATLDVEALARALTPDHGPSYFPGQHDVTIFGRTPREVAEKIAAAYAEQVAKVKP